MPRWTSARVSAGLPGVTTPIVEPGGTARATNAFTRALYDPINSPVQRSEAPRCAGPRCRFSAHLGHRSLAALGDLLLGEVLLVGRHRPDLPERVGDGAEAVAPEHVLELRDHGRTGSLSLLEGRV